jgi:GAF domain-containing protein
LQRCSNGSTILQALGQGAEYRLSTRRHDVEVLQHFCRVAALTLQNAALLLRLRTLPILLPSITEDLTMPQAMDVCARAVQSVCPAEALRFVVQEPASVRH